MARGILQLGPDMYVEWSSVADAPATYIMTKDELIRYLGGIEICRERIERMDKTGTSYIDYDNNESFFEFNRAGDKEECLTKEQMIEKYTFKG